MTTILSCRAQAPAAPMKASAPPVVESKKGRRPAVLGKTGCKTELDLADVFDQRKVRGVFVLHNEQDGCIRTSDPVLARTPFRPQSTFKIPNAFIGLETGLIPGPDHIWHWDKQPQYNPLWEQDLNLEQALNLSCVPCFRSLARDIGAERMGKYLGEMGYGNQDISGPIDLFWLNGGLRISPVEQALFVHRSLAGELPIHQAHIELVWNFLEQSPQEGVRLFAKTGLGRQDGLAIGWVIGYLKKGEQRWSFATFLQSLEGEDPSDGMPRLMPLRLEATREIVSRLKL